MKKRWFWTFYGALLALILIFTDRAVVYVQENIDEYEMYQPEHVLDDVLEIVKTAASAHTISQVVTYPEIVLSEYDPDWATDSVLQEYEEKTEAVSEWEYRILSGSYSASKREYGIYGDGELLAKIILTSNREWPVLADFLTVNEWKVEDVVALLKCTKYECAVEAPEGFSIIVNNVPLSVKSEGAEVTKNGDMMIYRISDLYAVPEVEGTDRLGNPCSFTESNGYFTADSTKYHLILPDTYEVYENGLKVAGEKVDSGTEYLFHSIFDSLTIADSYGQTIDYGNGDKVGAYDVSFRVPSNFEVLFLDENTADFITETEENELYQKLRNVETPAEGRPLKYDVYGHMPLQNKYTITDSIVMPDVLVFDNNGAYCGVEFENNYFEIIAQKGQDEIPDEILKEIDPLEIAKLWSLFMSDDIGGTHHGYETVEAFLLPDTQWYTFASKWYKGVDITFVSTHSGTEFVEERLTNYVRYTDDLFSCDIYLDKDMHVETTTFTGDVHDYVNSTFYFYRYNGEWKLYTFIDKLN